MLSNKCLNDKMNKVVFDPEQHHPPSRLVSHSGERAIWQDLRTGFLRGPLCAYSTSGIRLDEMQAVTMACPLMTFTLKGTSFKVDSLAFPHGHAAMLKATPIIGEGTGPLTEIPLLEWAAHQAKKVRRRQTTPPFLRARPRSISL
jgi:hypothetical protein